MVDAIGSPEMLGMVLARIGNKKPTRRLIEETRRTIEQEESPAKSHRELDMAEALEAFGEDMTRRFKQVNLVAEWAYSPNWEDGKELDQRIDILLDIIKRSEQGLKDFDYVRKVGVFAGQLRVAAEQKLIELQCRDAYEANPNEETSQRLAEAKDRFAEAYRTVEVPKLEDEPEPQPPKPGGLRRI
jgi:hypothetical protein